MNSDEITLFEIWQILTTRKWLILAMTVLVVLLAIAYLAITKPVFTSTGKIHIGSIVLEGVPEKGTILEDPVVIAQRLQAQYSGIAPNGEIILPRLATVKIDKKESGSILTMLAEDHSPAGAKAFLNTVAAQLLLDQKQLFESVMLPQRERLQTFNDQISQLNVLQDDLTRQIEIVRKNDSAQAALLTIEKGKNMDMLQQLGNQSFFIKMTLNEMYSYPSRLLLEPNLPASPSKPKRVLVLVLSVCSGLMMGVVTAFFAEFMSSVRQAKHPKPVSLDYQKEKDH